MPFHRFRSLIAGVDDVCVEFESGIKSIYIKEKEISSCFSVKNAASANLKVQSLYEPN